jgi:spore coat polysaccharide biosynthesis protein SpsF (cytidylyltransferase family)
MAQICQKDIEFYNIIQITTCCPTYSTQVLKHLVNINRANLAIMELSDPIISINGLGPKAQEKLNACGIYNLEKDIEFYNIIQITTCCPTYSTQVLKHLVNLFVNTAFNYFHGLRYQRNLP